MQKKINLIGYAFIKKDLFWRGLIKKINHKV